MKLSKKSCKRLIKHKKMILILVSVLFVIIISIVAIIWIRYEKAIAPVIPVDKIITKNIKDETNNIVDKPAIFDKPVTPNFDKSKYSTTESSSLWVIVNKQNPLSPISYVPNDLITTAGATISNRAKLDYDAMNSAAIAQGINFTIVSSYRSYNTQSSIYNNYVSTYGQSTTDTFSARPGYSEHQTGLTIDFGSNNNSNCNLENCFGTTIEGEWLEAHASEYGFIMRYTSENQQITGYKAEPWHFRYIGRELASEMKERSVLSLEEFFNVSGGEVYN